ncbi:hypothetical protein C0J52_02038, partial [Blattella germanica]
RTSSHQHSPLQITSYSISFHSLFISSTIRYRCQKMVGIHPVLKSCPWLTEGGLDPPKSFMIMSHSRTVPY